MPKTNNISTMFVFCFVDYHETDGDAQMTTPKVFRTKKAAMSAFNARVKNVLEREVSPADVTNRIEGDGYLHLCVNDKDHYTIYVKRVKVIE